MFRFLLAATLACGGTSTPVTSPEHALSEPEDDEWVSQCADLEHVEAEVVPTPSEAELLGCDDVEQREVSEPSAAMRRARRRAQAHTRRARAAQRGERPLEAVVAFEAARDIAPEDPGILAELGWARVAANRWCESTYPDDRDPYAGEEDPEPEPDSEYVACGNMLWQSAVEELMRAAERSREASQRGAIHYNLARAHQQARQPDEAHEHLRISLCLRPNDTVRRLFGESLWDLTMRDADLDAETSSWEVSRKPPPTGVNPAGPPSNFEHSVLATSFARRKSSCGDFRSPTRCRSFSRGVEQSSSSPRANLERGLRAPAHRA